MTTWLQLSGYLLLTILALYVPSQAHAQKIESKSILLLALVLLLSSCNHNQQKARRLYDLPDDSWGFVAFSPDNKLFAMPIDNNQVAVYKISNRLHDLYEIGNTPGYVTFSWDSTQLAVSTVTSLQIWDTKENVLIQTLSVEGIYNPQENVHNYLGSLAYSPDDSRLALNATGYLRIWDIQTGEIVLDKDRDGGGSGRIIFSPGGDLIAYEDRRLHIFDIAKNERIVTITDYAGTIAFNPDGTELITITGNWVNKWNVMDGELIEAFTLGKQQTFNDFSLIEPVPSNTKEAIGFSYTYHRDSDVPTFDAYISRWNIETKELIWRERIENLALIDFNDLFISPSGETAVLIGYANSSDSVWQIGE